MIKYVLIKCKSTRYSCPILMRLVELPQQISKNSQASNFMKICPVGAELVHAHRQTDKTKIIVAFSILLTRLKMITTIRYAAERELEFQEETWIGSLGCT